MSRIHEALKKAAEERAAGTHGELPIEVAVEGTTTPAPPALEEPGSVHPPVAQQELGMGVDFTVEDLLKRAVRHEWKLNPHTLLFSNGNLHTPGAEEFRRLRSNLYQIRSKDEVRAIVVTSAVPGEGKSFVASNLVQAFARQHERRALCIDADLRVSALHTSFGAPAGPGLSEYLRGEADELSIIQRGSSDNLFFIPAGASVPNPLELIGNGRLKQLLTKLTPFFDWIVLDSPPVLPVSDVGLIAEMCDGILLVVRAELTPFDMAQKAVKQLADRRLLGVVLNAVKPGAAYGSYYYQHQYHKQAGGSKSTLKLKNSD